LTPAGNRGSISEVLENWEGGQMTTNYFTVREVATLLRVTPQTVNTWCRLGSLKAIRAGRSWRIAPADLDEFTKQQTKEGGAKKADALALSY
jgi:excisionase family DNA binding protein